MPDPEISRKTLTKMWAMMSKEDRARLPEAVRREWLENVRLFHAKMERKAARQKAKLHQEPK